MAIPLAKKFTWMNSLLSRGEGGREIERRMRKEGQSLLRGKRETDVVNVCEREEWPIYTMARGTVTPVRVCKKIIRFLAKPIKFVCAKVCRKSESNNRYKNVIVANNSFRGSFFYVSNFFVGTPI